MRRLLVVACSACKNKIDGFLPAIERYDGPVFRVLRKYLREESTGVADVLILSAKFGLISANKLIPDYDLEMSEAVAATIRPLVLVKLRKALALTYQEIGFCLGDRPRINQPVY